MLLLGRTLIISFFVLLNNVPTIFMLAPRPIKAIRLEVYTRPYRSVHGVLSLTSAKGHFCRTVINSTKKAIVAKMSLYRVIIPN